MSEVSDGQRWVLLDASVAITLAKVDAFGAALDVRGRLVLPEPVESEITSELARSRVENAIEAGALETRAVDAPPVTTAAEHLGREQPVDDPPEEGYAAVDGDVALLALAIQCTREAAVDDPVVLITDDKPLRTTCKALSIPVSGSIGVLVRAVERGGLAPETATEKLYAMDEVGTRLSASLVREAERLIDEAAEK